MDTVVSPEWLKERLGQSNVKVLDASWYMPVQKRDGQAEYKAKRIKGASFFDVDGISDPNTSLPHMLPSEAAFGAAMDVLGVSNDDTVVVYDGMGCFSAPRAWWTFQVFGHNNVAVLDGGLPAWEAAGGAVDTSSVDEDDMHAAVKALRAAVSQGNAQPKYKAHLDKSKVRDLQAMLANISAAKEQVMDARSAGRFVGTEPEPRPGLKGGHIPGARCLPFPAVLEGGTRLKDAAALRDVFASAGVDLGKPLVGSCGSGLTACILALAAHRATGGKLLVPVYDGSWTEWGGRDDVPISTEAP